MQATVARARPLRLNAAAVTASEPASRKAGSYEPSSVRLNPAPQAANAAPNWWAANTQANTTPTRSRPNTSRHSATVGGTVATQSRP